MGLQYNIVANEEGEKNVTLFREGQKPLVAASTHPNFEAIINGLMADDESVSDLFDIALAAGMKFERLTDRITASNGWIYLDGERMDNALTEQVVRFLQEGVDDWKPLVNFYENLQQNPNEHSREELYSFIQKNGITITDDGMLVGYKSLNPTSEKGLYQSSNGTGTAIVDGVVQKGHIKQRVGSIVEMPRSEVIWDPNDACSVGLHIGNYKYAKTFASKLFEAHINPRDVVSVPAYGDKMRVCRYVLVKACNAEIEKPVVKAAEPKKDGRAKQTAKKVAKVFTGDPTVRVGDVYEDRDKRRAGRQIRVTAIAQEVMGGGKFDVFATTKPYPDVVGSKETKIATRRLASRSYKRTKRGKKQ